MASAVCLVQGASRGIGLGLCRALLARSAETSVIATCRNPDNARDLQELHDKHNKQLTVLQVDATDARQIERAASDVQKQFGHLDLLINSAGIIHPSGHGEKQLKDVTAEDVMATLQLNTVGPLMMAKFFSPLLQKAEGVIGVQSPEYKSFHAGVLVNISAKTGSIAANDVGGWYSYRLAKAALNMATKNLSIELGRGRKKVICISVHPGVVDTQLTRSFQRNVPNLLTVDQSAQRLMDVINSLKVEDSGKFLNYDRTELPF